MLFNSLDFAFFLPIAFMCYWLLSRFKLKYQNVFLVLSSYFFYGCWDWRFLSLIIISTLTDYSIGLLISKSQKTLNRKLLLVLSLSVNLGILGFFKYYNFFVENFISVFSFFGKTLDVNTLKFVLPVGISFYTFQTLSYTIDVYRKRIAPTKDIIAFSAFVSFFPQLVAGPIERAKHLLPQFFERRKLDYNTAADGLKQMLWGFFKKMVIADNCAFFVDQFFSDYHNYSGSTLLLGAFLFSIQIYCDFSGYTDIAIGVSRLFGFNLTKNFNYPYFSRNIAEFWRRWHISLSTWFRDYLYIPLGGSRGGRLLTIRNVLLVFIISAFWHGANWTFIIWGIIHALLFVPLLLANTNRKYLGTVKKISFKTTINILLTFLLTTLAWVFFRAKDVSSAIGYLKGILSKTLFSVPEFNNRLTAVITLVFIMLLFVVEWRARTDNHGLETLGNKWKKPYRWLFYYLLIFVILYFKGNQEQFIYFQF